MCIKKYHIVYSGFFWKKCSLSIDYLSITSSTYDAINASSVFKHLQNSLQRMLAGGNGMGAPCCTCANAVDPDASRIKLIWQPFLTSLGSIREFLPSVRVNDLGIRGEIFVCDRISINHRVHIHTLSRCEVRSHFTFILSITRFMHRYDTLHSSGCNL